jgi:hypothetical protein
MFELSRVLDVPVSFFFDDMPDDIKTPEGVRARALEENEQTAYEPDPLARRETLELVRAYYKILDPKVRKRLFELTKSLSGTLADE